MRCAPKIVRHGPYDDDFTLLRFVYITVFDSPASSPSNHPIASDLSGQLRLTSSLYSTILPDPRTTQSFKMKSFFTYLTIASAFSPLALAAPASDSALNKRLTAADGPAALARMDTLFTDITRYTATISTPPTLQTFLSSLTDKPYRLHSGCLPQGAYRSRKGHNQRNLQISCWFHQFSRCRRYFRREEPSQARDCYGQAPGPSYRSSCRVGFDY